jgi:signal transduction histidine kinase
VVAPNPSTPSTPAAVTPEGPTQKELDDLKQALADALKNAEDMKKKLDSSLPLSSTSGLPADAASAAVLLRAEAAEGQLADLQQQNAALKKEGQVADLQEHFNALLQVL